MDAVLKHLGLRSDFIVCHPDVIDDPLLRARRPPPASSSLPFQTHTHSRTRVLSYELPLQPARASPCCTPRTFTENFKH